VCVYYILWYKVRKRVAIIYRSVLSIYSYIQYWPAGIISLSLSLSLSLGLIIETMMGLWSFFIDYLYEACRNGLTDLLCYSLSEPKKRKPYSLALALSLSLSLCTAECWWWWWCKPWLGLYISFSICRHKTMEKGIG